MHNLCERSNESIRRAMDENQGAIFAIHDRALPRHLLMQGRVVFELLINPDSDASDLR
ncbi:MAG: hypothetical protein NXI15_13940 [Gammaproteobacteria bacterium]|nr:hypothetical protein [Gammaproteobacteria bacterium]